MINKWSLRARYAVIMRIKRRVVTSMRVNIRILVRTCVSMIAVGRICICMNKEENTVFEKYAFANCAVRLAS